MLSCTCRGVEMVISQIALKSLIMLYQSIPSIGLYLTDSADTGLRTYSLTSSPASCSVRDLFSRFFSMNFATCLIRMKNSIVGHSEAKNFGIIFGRRLFQQNPMSRCNPFFLLTCLTTTPYKLSSNSSDSPLLQDSQQRHASSLCRAYLRWTLRLSERPFL